MNEAMARLRGLFVESAPEVDVSPGALTASPPAGERVAVLGPPRAVEAGAAAIALAGVQATASRCGLLALWGEPSAGWHAPAGRPAARAAAALRARGLPAAAAGRLVTLELSPEEPLARAELARASAAIRGPAVLAVLRARDEDVDRVLTDHDALVLLESGDGASTQLAATSLSRLGRPLLGAAPPGRAVGRLALCGVAWPARVKLQPLAVTA